MDAELQAELDNTTQSLLSTYQLALTYGDQESQNEKVYLNLMKQLCSIENDAKRSETILEKAKETARTAETFQKVCDDLEQKAEKFDATKCATYKAFLKQLNDMKKNFINHQNTELSGPDDIILSGEICTVDPLTKQQIQNPVRNTICGHHYEKTSIMAIITNKSQQQIKCPVAGCGNNNIITAKHLIEDNAFKLHLQQLAE